MGEVASMAGVGGAHNDSSGRITGTVHSIVSEALTDDVGATVVFVLAKLPPETAEEVAAPALPHVTLSSLPLDAPGQRQGKIRLPDRPAFLARARTSC